MLYIIEGCLTDTNGSMITPEEKRLATKWHIGEPLPAISPTTRVMTFQADEDELEVILEALRERS